MPFSFLYWINRHLHIPKNKFHSIQQFFFTNTYLAKLLFQDCNCKHPNHIHQFSVLFHNNWWVVALLISSHRPCFHLAHNHALNQVQFLPVRFKNFFVVNNDKKSHTNNIISNYWFTISKIKKKVSRFDCNRHGKSNWRKIVQRCGSRTIVNLWAFREQDHFIQHVVDLTLEPSILTL